MVRLWSEQIIRSLVWLCIMICACSTLMTACAASAKYRMARDSYENGILLRDQAKEHQSYSYFRRTVTYLRPFERKNSLDPSGLLLLGNSYLYLNRYEDARKVYWKIMQQENRDRSDKKIRGNALLGLGETYERQGYPEAAGEFYESILNNASIRSEDGHAEAGIRWAGVRIHAAEKLRDKTMVKQSDKIVATVVKELTKLVHKYPAHAGLRRALGNALFVESGGENVENLQEAFTHVRIALDIPNIPVVLQRMLMDDLNTIADRLLGLLDTPEEQQEFRNRYLELSDKLNPRSPGDRHAENH